MNFEISFGGRRNDLLLEVLVLPWLYVDGVQVVRGVNCILDEKEFCPTPSIIRFLVGPTWY